VWHPSLVGCPAAGYLPSQRLHRTGPPGDQTPVGPGRSKGRAPASWALLYEHSGERRKAIILLREGAAR
jgi:hypothetical protein